MGESTLIEFLKTDIKPEDRKYNFEELFKESLIPTCILEQKFYCVSCKQIQPCAIFMLEVVNVKCKVSHESTKNENKIMKKVLGKGFCSVCLKAIATILSKETYKNYFSDEVLSNTNQNQEVQEKPTTKKTNKNEKPRRDKKRSREGDGSESPKSTTSGERKDKRVKFKN